jgi:arylsulfatase A-like enzyme
LRPMDRRLLAALAVSLLAALLIAACSRRDATSDLSSLECRGCNVMILTIDDLRTDVIGSYGSRYNLTDNIDRFTGQSFLFRNNHAAAPHTYPSVASILTSTYIPGSQGINGTRTLPGILGLYGFSTAFFSGNQVLDRESVGNGIDEFYDMWEVELKKDGEDVYHNYDSAEINQRLFPWLERNKDRKFFLYVQYIDPHNARIIPDGAGKPDEFEEYKGLVESQDASIGSLMAELRRLGIYERTIIILTSDHGEEFYDHGKRGHGKTLYEELIHVPLIMHVPDGKGGMQISSLTSSIDIMPTVLQLEGIPVNHEARGLSLVGLMLGKKEDFTREVYSSTDVAGELVAVIAGDMKLIMRLNVTKDNAALLSVLGAELYDLKADPLERQNEIGRMDSSLLGGRLVNQSYKMIFPGGYPQMPHGSVYPDTYFRNQQN